VLEPSTLRTNHCGRPSSDAAADSSEEADTYLGSAEEAALRDKHGEGDLSPAQRGAVAFLFRILRLANNSANSEGTVPFSELARMVGETKPQGLGRR
jgi:hypothetical protein